jgi:8-oxo-dGTP pyrophosphatase MutT (NUDIX family)
MISATSLSIAFSVLTVSAGTAWMVAHPDTKHKVLSRAVGFESAAVLTHTASRKLVAFHYNPDSEYEFAAGKVELSDVAGGTRAYAAGLYGRDTKWSECVARATAKREVKEETGFDVHPLRLKFVAASGKGVTKTGEPAVWFAYEVPEGKILDPNAEFAVQTHLEQVNENVLKNFRKFNRLSLIAIHEKINDVLGWEAVKV